MDRRRRVHPAAQEALNRREFLRRAAMAGIALPTAAAIFAACSDPKKAAGNAGTTTIPLARRDKPVTLPIYDDNPAIADGLEIEKGSTLEIFNWDSYFYKKVLEDFEQEYDVKINWTTFNNMSEAKQKMQAGQVADVFFPTVDMLGQMVGAKLLQPLNHSYIPNMEANVWPAYWDGDVPFYDQGWRYTVPYVIYTTGIGYRRDVISDEEAADQGYDLLWNADYKGKVGLYDDYRETLSMAMLRDGITDINTGDQATIDAALDSLKELIPLDVRTSINGTYVGLSEAKYDVHQAWSGDMIGAQYYLPAGTSPDVLGYWYPADHAGAVGNDLIVVPSSSREPRAGAHVHQLPARQEARVRELHLERLPAALHVDQSRELDLGRRRAGEPSARGRDGGGLQGRLLDPGALAGRRRQVAGRLGRVQHLDGKLSSAR